MTIITIIANDYSCFLDSPPMEVPAAPASVQAGETVGSTDLIPGGTPNSWMVYFMENPGKMDDLGMLKKKLKPPNNFIELKLGFFQRNHWGPVLESLSFFVLGVLFMF